MELTWGREGVSDPMLPPYKNFCKCAGCGLYFGGVNTFDLHRRVGVGRERVCLAPSKVSNKKGEQVLHLNNRGYWVQKFSQS